MSDLVIRKVTEGVWTFSRPFTRFGFAPIGGRSTAISLKSGGVWVLASTPLTDETKETLKELGTVKYICGGDSRHYLFLSEFKKAYPEAKVYTVPDAVPKLPSDLQLEGVFGRDPPETKYEFEDEIKPVFFTGHRSQEVAYFHAQSKSLMVADLIFNLPAKEQYSKLQSKPARSQSSSLHPRSWLHSKIISFSTADRAAMKRDLKTVANLDFNRIIPCHGDVIEEDGKEIFRYAFRAFLD